MPQRSERYFWHQKKKKTSSWNPCVLRSARNLRRRVNIYETKTYYTSGGFKTRIAPLNILMFINNVRRHCALEYRLKCWHSGRRIIRRCRSVVWPRPPPSAAFCYPFVSSCFFTGVRRARRPQGWSWCTFEPYTAPIHPTCIPICKYNVRNKRN